MDEKTAKKMCQDKEKIKEAARKLEKQEAREAAHGRRPGLDPVAQLWTGKYAP